MQSLLLQCAQLSPMCFLEVGKHVFFYSLFIVLVTLYLKSLFIHCVGYSVSEKTELHFRKRQNSRVVEY